MSLGSNIKIFRKKLGLTQEELASRLCVTSQAVSKWESEAGLPDTAQIVPLAKALSVSTDSLFGIDSDDYDKEFAREIIFEADSIRDNGNQKEGAVAAADYLAEKCEENPFNYGIHMRYVQSVAHMSRFFSMGNLSDDEAEKWHAYVKAAENRALYIFRYSNDSELVDKCHYALAWIYWHDKEYEKGREHIKELPSISNNMLQETINSYYAYVEKGLDGWRASVRDNLQNFVRAINKQLVYGAEAHMWECPLEETVSFCKWAVSVIEQFMQNEKMKAHCQGFYRDTVKYLVAAYLRNGKAKEAAAAWKNLTLKISEYVEFCDNIRKMPETSAVSEFGEKAAQNMNHYTKEFAESKEAFMLGQLKSWCSGKDFAEFEKLI
ncbi:MAG: helix-turn-helix transcriptional regulator [Spirochaetaceae bacterium]|nr:helix-turn-helix transcriptional regulator [Spirochaetaceae bacterium]